MLSRLSGHAAFAWVSLTEAGPSMTGLDVDKPVLACHHTCHVPQMIHCSDAAQHVAFIHSQTGHAVLEPAAIDLASMMCTTPCGCVTRLQG